MEENSWYLYRHLKPNGQVFYIGIGKTKNYQRAFSKNNRNKHWKNIVNKYDYEVQILKEGLNKNEACEIEKILISWYKRIDCCGGILVNMTDGGEGVENKIVSEETKEKLRGKRPHVSGKLSFLWGKPKSEATKKKLSEAHKGKKGLADEDNPMYGKVGDLNPMWGKTHTEKVKKEHSERMQKSIINTDTLEVFESAKTLSKILGIKSGTLAQRIRGKYNSYFPFIYKDDYDNGERYVFEKSEAYSKRVINIESLQIFESISIASNVNNIPNLKYNLRKKTKKYPFMYLSEYKLLNPDFKND